MKVVVMDAEHIITPHISSDVVLVTYASRMGSTAGVAAAIGKVLADNGVQVDVRPMSEVTDTTPYRAVVAGSAIRGGRWLPEAMVFMLKNKTDLSRKPFAAFLVCMTMSFKNENYRTAVKDWLDPVRTLVRPVREGFFAGALDTRNISSLRDRLKFRLSVLLGVWKEGDHRDWKAIHDWAAQLKPALET
jgi:menaquinone-dependent protoporphyrinogen oxidase